LPAFTVGMADLVFVLVVLAFFGIAVAVLKGVERL
jgi:hypothetical protein